MDIIRNWYELDRQLIFPRGQRQLAGDHGLLAGDVDGMEAARWDAERMNEGALAGHDGGALLVGPLEPPDRQAQDAAAL